MSIDIIFGKWIVPTCWSHLFSFPAQTIPNLDTSSTNLPNPNSFEYEKSGKFLLLQFRYRVSCIIYAHNLSNLSEMLFQPIGKKSTCIAWHRKRPSKVYDGCDNIFTTKSNFIQKPFERLLYNENTSKRKVQCLIPNVHMRVCVRVLFSSVFVHVRKKKIRSSRILLRQARNGRKSI